MRLSLPSSARSPVQSAFERDQRYRLVLLGSLALTLGLALGLTRLPWAPPVFRADWRVAGADHPLMMTVAPPAEAAGGPERPASNIPATVLTEPKDEPPSAPAETAPSAPQSDADPDAERDARLAAMARMPIVSFAEEQPDIVGGLNSLYLRVRYPLAAQEAGIQGLVIVRFVVETDGRPSQIEVVRSLHPLCDAAAVEAIGATTFRPARQNGQTVRIRMSLPIRFVLLDEATGEPLKTDTTSTNGGALEAHSVDP